MSQYYLILDKMNLTTYLLVVPLAIHAPGCVFHKLQFFAAATHPTGDSSRVAKYKGIIRHVSGDHGTGTDEGILADRISTNNGSIGAN